MASIAPRMVVVEKTILRRPAAEMIDEVESMCCVCVCVCVCVCAIDSKVEVDL